MPTNQEFTTVSREDAEGTRHNDTLFQLLVNDAHEGEPVKSLASHIRFMHMPTKVLLWTHASVLPEWAFGQQEVNGNKNMNDRTTWWFIDDIIADGTGNDFRNRTVHVDAKKPTKRSFVKKFVELQILMLQHNAGLTAHHPYQSEPIEWPFDLSGISFWTQNEKQEQIYMIGNLLDWWVCAVAISVFVGIVAADMLARRRGLEPIEDGIRNRLYRNTLFFLGTWACHYLPFFLMGRQRFLHHYLPAHLASALVAGAVLNFVLIETVDYPVSVAGPRTRLRPEVRAEMNKTAWAVLLGILVLVTASFLWLAPLTYGLA